MKTKHLFLSILFFMVFSVFALQAKVVVGTVITTEGRVYSINQQGKERLLKRGSTIFTEETIYVGKGAKTQLRMTDGSLINLIPETEYTVNNYSFNRKRQRDVFSSELIKGGLRHLTGRIAKKDPQNVSVRTPIATIGVRGTYFTLLYKDDPHCEEQDESGERSCAILYVECTSGEISVKSDDGTINIGPDTGITYTTVTERAPPEPLKEAPESLQGPDFEAPQDSIPITPSGESPGIFIQGGC